VSLLFRPDRPLARSLANGGIELVVRRVIRAPLDPHAALPRLLAVPLARSGTGDRSAPSDEVAPECGRAGIVRDALRATLADEPLELSTIFCDDVVGRTPTTTVRSRAELEIVCQAGDDALQLVEVRIEGIDLVADKAIAEWQVTAVFRRPFLLGDDRLVEPTGRVVELAGVTIAEFDGDRIRAFRHYLDDAALFEQMLSLS
jgi:hypothetical protein